MKRNSYSLLATIIFIWILTGFISCQNEFIDPEDPKNDTVSQVYNVFEMDIQVENNVQIISKEKEDYLNCTVYLDGKDIYEDYSGTARIRGRGNSTWFWYDKKPYRIKLDEKSEILGLKSNSDWVLLANYRDPTNLMNAFGFEVAQWMDMPYTNHSRFIEIRLNGDYIGLYQLTEQVEQGNNRVDISETDGLLICLDANDGPYLAPDAKNNFWSTVFELPVCIKHPKEPTNNQLSSIQDDFAKLEVAIYDSNYESVAALLDIPSLIDYLIIQELVYNVEIDAPRSTFIHKDRGGKYVMGPVWDFDAGFDFDWSSMMTGHNYFTAQELVLGTNPATHRGGYSISDFFTQMFRDERFVKEYKNRWNEIKDDLLEHAWTEMEKYILNLDNAMQRDFERWPIDRNCSTEINRMKSWLTERVAFLTTVINNYPEGNTSAIKINCGEISYDVNMLYSLGYQQNVRININEDSVLSKLGVARSELYSSAMVIVPLHTDGSEGVNNTNGVFGAWFEGDNNPGEWSNGHVFIEIYENLTQWECGLRNEGGYCSVGDTHKVKMQYQFTKEEEIKTLTIAVDFAIDE